MKSWMRSLYNNKRKFTIITFDYLFKKRNVNLRRGNIIMVYIQITCFNKQK